jgi:hypothetical protein
VGSRRKRSESRLIPLLGGGDVDAAAVCDEAVEMVVGFEVDCVFDEEGFEITNLVVCNILGLSVTQ